jgi:hypothetical protein
MDSMSLQFRRLLHFASALSILLLLFAFSRCAAAQAQANSDTMVLKDGNTIRGTLVSEAGGVVTFQTPSLGKMQIKWKDIQELHTTGSFAVLPAKMKAMGKHKAAQVPVGPLDVTSDSVTVHPAQAQPVPQPIPTKNAAFIVSQDDLNKQLHHNPGFFQGWNGALTAGATLVTATQNQYTFSGSLGLARVVPTVTWLRPSNRTSADFTGSFGKITQPAYVGPTGPVAAVTSKTSILHFDAERDEYFSPRMFGLGQTAFDHNYSQDLSLQQIYGGGLGWTVLQNAKQQADVRATVQYEKQSFISAPAGSNKNLIGSTFSADYLLKGGFITYTQTAAYIPAWNNTAAWSTDETNTFAFPGWKRFGFSMGTIDSYLNDPPASYPPTKRNSFQFTMGLTYAIKSKY